VDRTDVQGNADCIAYAGRSGERFRPLLSRLSPPTADWLAARGAAWPDAALSLRFERYTANTFGMVTVFVPAEHFGSDAEASAWLEAMRDTPRPLFEHRVDNARLPALPPPLPPDAPPSR